MRQFAGLLSPRLKAKLVRELAFSGTERMTPGKRWLGRWWGLWLAVSGNEV